MNKRSCLHLISTRLRRALLNHHAASGLTQEALAEQLHISTRACSALENGECAFSAFTLMGLFCLLPKADRNRLFNELCDIMTEALRDAQ